MKRMKISSMVILALFLAGSFSLIATASKNAFDIPYSLTMSLQAEFVSSAPQLKKEYSNAIGVLVQENNNSIGSTYANVKDDKDYIAQSAYQFSNTYRGSFFLEYENDYVDDSVEVSLCMRPATGQTGYVVSGLWDPNLTR